MNDYKIKIYTSFNHEELRNNWRSLEKKIVVFPQMQYDWIAPWWERNHDNKELYIVTVFDEGDEIVGLSPFCIHKDFGIKILRSIPIHYGDFYNILSKNRQIADHIIQHLKKCEKWSVVHLFNCFEQSETNSGLIEKGFEYRRVTRILEVNFSELDFQDYLKTISSNSRGNYRKKLRRLKREGETKFIAVRDWRGYLKYFPDTKRLYDMRWEGDTRPLLSDEYYEMRNASLKPLFEKGSAVLFLVFHKKEVIAFRLGFLKDGVFYDWKTAHNPDFNYYSPGFLSVGLAIKHLIDIGFQRFNFMTGNYRYKRSYCNVDDDLYNNDLLYTNKNLLGKAYLKYRLKWREQIKAFAEKHNLKSIISS